MTNSVNFAQIANQLGANPEQTTVGSAVSGVKNKVHVSVDLKLWKQYEDDIVRVPLPKSIEDRLEKYGDKAYGTHSRFSNLEAKSKAMIIDYLEKKYQSLLKRKVAIEKQYDACCSYPQNTEEEKISVDKKNIAHAEYHLLNLLESLFTGVPLDGRPSYEGPFPFDEMV